MRDAQPWYERHPQVGAGLLIGTIYAIGYTLLTAAENFFRWLF